MGRLLRIPLFYKILVANAVAVAVAAGLGAWLTAAHGLGRSGDMTPLATAAIIAVAAGVVSALVHAVLLRRALTPLRELARVAARLQAEGPDADLRATISRTSDRNLAELTRVFNGMLDTLADYRMRLRRLAARTLEAAEDERRLVARRLQEDTAQRLASLMVGLEVIRKSEDPFERDDAVEELRQATAETLESVRRTARDLYPPELGDIGLEQALRAFARTLSNGSEAGSRSVPRVDLDLQDLDEELGKECRLALYRILQEAIANACVHADAEFVRVELRRTGSVLRGVVRDDGRGLPTGGNGSRPEGLGLLTMRERAANAGGRLDISSRLGAGTTVTVELPLACLDANPLAAPADDRAGDRRQPG